MRLPDAPTVEPRGILPCGDGDGYSCCALLSSNIKSNDDVGNDPIICIDGYTSFYRRARDIYAEAIRIYSIWLWGIPRNYARHDDKDLRKGK